MVLPVFGGADVLRTPGGGSGLCGAGNKGRTGLPVDLAAGGKAQSHFGDREGALEAAARGLLLEPGDYEFLTLKKEIEAGEPLERMEYHWINPGADQALQQGRMRTQKINGDPFPVLL